MKIKFNKHDLWWGLYWKSEEKMRATFLGENDIITRNIVYKEITIYICIIPCFPIIFKFWIKKKKKIFKGLK